MKIKMLIAVLCLSAVAAFAAKHSDFSGSWQFNTDKSKNVGMMAQMKMTYAVAQSASALDVTAHTTFQGRDEDRKTRFDLAGGPSTNESPMGGSAELKANSHASLNHHRIRDPGSRRVGGGFLC